MCIFEKHDVVKCEVINEFFFVVSGYVVWECIRPLKAIEYFVADSTSEKGFPVMILSNGTACEWVT